LRKSKGQLLNIVAIRQPVIAQDVAVVPEFLDKLVRLVRHEVTMKTNYVEVGRRSTRATSSCCTISRIIFDIFFHALAHSDQRQSNYFPGFLVISNNDTFAHVYAERPLWFSESDVKRVGLAIVLPGMRPSPDGKEIHTRQLLLFRQAARYRDSHHRAKFVKVTVESERMTDSEPLHNHFASAICEAPFLIAILLKDFRRGAKIGLANPFQLSHRLVQ
jgi:hypothetical protein